MFSFSKQAQDNIKKQFEKRQIEKTYYAIVERRMEVPKGTWESYLKEDDFFYVKSTSASQAVTQYEVIATQKNYSLLCLTGRKNQIRVHCSEARHSIIGDKKYEATCNPMKRVGLHAQEISFTHPKTEKRMRFSVSIPECFYKLMKMSAIKLH